MSPQVSVIKVKIHEATGMAAGKQKLQYEVSLTVNLHFYLFSQLIIFFVLIFGIVLFLFQGMFIKDSNSLAYYNMNNGSVIHLALKERGGRKK